MYLFGHFMHSFNNCLVQNWIQTTDSITGILNYDPELLMLANVTYLPKACIVPSQQLVQDWISVH